MNRSLLYAPRRASRFLASALLLVALFGAGGIPVRAAPRACTADDFARAVDEAGAALRAFNAEAQPRLDKKLELLRTKKGWSKEETEDKGLAALQDRRLASVDAKSDSLLTTIDTLGRPPEGRPPDCAALDKLEAAGRDLLDVMKEKSAYTLARLDQELGLAPAAEAPARERADGEANAASGKDTNVPGALDKAGPRPAAEDPASWAATAELSQEAGGAGERQSAALPPEAFATADEGYTIEEIRDATKGFFGTISTNLATVLEHAFSVAGRPTAYVLGSEGGGAFLAGVRYGEGTLYMRDGGRSKVYWHGPSIGTDVGAAGSRTLFLIYKLQGPEGLFRSFTGVDGSAYLVGGIGFTLMKGGPVVLAPIRTGLGLRFGANIGYVRFTPRATWNPF
jgi:hypothetical protein